MKTVYKLLLLFFLLSIIILLNFLIFGERFQELFSLEGSREFMAGFGLWAGPVGVLLLVLDLVLPIPSSGVIGGIGASLGVGRGFLWGWLGLVSGGLIGYGAARLGGKRWADKLAEPEDQERYRAMFDSWGGLALVSTRLLPIVPEVLSVLAGLYRMHFSRFLVATLLGTVPPALIYAWLGARAREHPGPAIWGLVLVTALGWLLFLQVKKRQEKQERNM